MEKVILSTFDAARYCQVHPGTIKNWIKKDNLKAFKTPGGHRRIYKCDLDKFLKEKNIPIHRESSDQRKKILIIDSKYNRRERISRTLQHRADYFEVAAASNCFQAGELLVLFKPDLVILEETLAGINAVEICRHIRSSLYLKNTKILIIAKDSPAENVTRQADAVLSRTVRSQRLLAELERILGIKT